MTCGVYVHGRSADTNLADIHEEMSELLGKQVIVQNKSLKIPSGVHASFRKSTKKCAMKNKRKKNDCRVKNFVV